ncbi:hypothetical protein ACOMHN_025067 [Nucella lapillus]
MEQVRTEGGARSLHDPTSPTNFSNPMYDNLHRESILLSGAPPAPNESSTDDPQSRPPPPPPPRRGDVLPDKSAQMKMAHDGPELRIEPRALDPTDDDEQDTTGLVRQGSL